MSSSDFSENEFFDILGISPTKSVIKPRVLLDIELRLHKDYADKMRRNIPIPDKEMCLYVWLVGYIASHWKMCDECVKKFGVAKVLSEINNLKHNSSERCSQFGRIMEEYLDNIENAQNPKLQKFS